MDIKAIGAEDGESPLRVTSSQLPASGNAITGLTDRLTNTGSATVVASQTQLRLKEASGARTVILFRLDGSTGGGVLPGQTLDLTAALKQERRSPLKRAEMMTTFAITETGVRMVNRGPRAEQGGSDAFSAPCRSPSSRPFFLTFSGEHGTIEKGEQKAK